jgi:hypothetical protein
MENSSLKNKLLIKYLIVIGLVYSILKIVPSQQINNKDILLILGIISIGFILLDSFSNTTNESFADTNQAPKSALFTSSKVLGKPPSPTQMPKQMQAPLPKDMPPPSPTQMPKQMPAPLPKDMPSPLPPQSPKQTPPQSPKQMPKRSSSPQQNSRLESQPDIPKAGCSLEVEKIKRELEYKMEKQVDELKRQLELSKMNDLKSSDNKIASRYLDTLIVDLNNDGIINKADIDNIRLKMSSKILSVDDIITSLEMMKKQGNKSNKKISKDMKDKNSDADYNELPNEFYKPIGDRISNKWDNDYTLLNTNNWQVPMTRPPVCINTTPCTTCPVASSGNSISLKEWDNSRNITRDLITINKKWVEDQ